MKPVESKMLAQATLFDTYAPVERYFQDLQSRTGATPSPAVPLPAEDAYVIRLLAGWHPAIHAVLDLSGPATCGATTVLWASQDRSRRVFVPAYDRDCERGAWVQVLNDTLSQYAGTSPVECVDEHLTAGNLPALIDRCGGGHRPLLVVLPLASAEDENPLESLASIFAAHPRTIVVTLPLGLIGQDRRLGPLVEWTSANGFRLIALRELCPFLGSSQVAIVSPADDVQTAETLKRIQRLFTSNFDFLSLAHQMYTLTRANTKLDSQLKDAKAKGAELERVLREREAHMHDAQMKIEELDHSAQGWARECERIAAHAMRLEAQVRLLTCGTSWSLVQHLRWLRQRLAPRDSLRERCGRYVMRMQRRLRGAA